MARTRRNKKISQKILKGQCAMFHKDLTDLPALSVILGSSSSISIKYFGCTGPDD